MTWNFDEKDCEYKCFTNVEKLDHIEAIKKYNDYNILLIIKPPSKSSFGEYVDVTYESLLIFKGNKFILIEKLRKLSKELKEELLKNWRLVNKILDEGEKIYFFTRR